MILARALLVLALIASVIRAVAAAGAVDPQPPPLRLPEGARPLRYAATLVVVPGSDNVQGEIAIDVELAHAHPLPWLNADALTVQRAVVGDPAIPVRILAGHDQFVGLAFDPPLSSGSHRFACHPLRERVEVLLDL